MECNSTRRVQSEDNETSQSTSVCLRTPLILRKVMEHFSNKELLQYSVVSKQWNYEARSLMRLRGTFIARLSKKKSLPRTCRQLSIFAGHVRQMNVVPFSGMKMNILATDFQEHQKRLAPTPGASLDPAYNVILDRLQWKYFSVSFHPEWKRCPKWNCQAFLLAKRILEDFSGVFQVLELYPPRSPGISIEPIFQDYTFPRLKTLRIQSFTVPLDEGQQQFIKTVVARAPNLQVLRLKGPVDIQENLLEGSSALLLVIGPPTDLIKDPISEDLAGRLRLKQMKLSFFHNYFSLQLFDRSVPQVLQTSRTALKSLELNLACLVKLMCHGICLENVRDLTILSNPRDLSFLEPDMLRLVNAFDFTRSLPSLKRTAIRSCKGEFFPEEIRQIVEQGNAAWREPSPDRAVNIKLLVFVYFRDIPLNFAPLFPDAEILQLRLFKGPSFHYETIWTCWTHVKQIHIQIDQSFFKRVRQQGEQISWGQNVDSFFCGIFPEEVDELREQDEEYLKAVNIVPVMPSITYMPALDTLKLVLTGVGCFSGKNDPTFIFSKVTGLIAFARCPNLTVTIHTHMEWEDAFSHMKDYVSLVFQ